MVKLVTPDTLTHALIRMGFSEVRSGAAGSHRLFRHGDSGLQVTVPNSGELVRPVHLSAIRRQVSNFEIASDDEFDRQLSRRRNG